MYIRSYYDTFKSICVIHGYIFVRLIFSVAKARGRRVNQHLHLRGGSKIVFYGRARGRRGRPRPRRRRADCRALTDAR
jgi:hypothetical protein